MNTHPNSTVNTRIYIVNPSVHFFAWTNELRTFRSIANRLWTQTTSALYAIKQCKTCVRSFTTDLLWTVNSFAWERSWQFTRKIGRFTMEFDCMPVDWVLAMFPLPLAWTGLAVWWIAHQHDIVISYWLASKIDEHISNRFDFFTVSSSRRHPIRFSFSIRFTLSHL